MHNHRHSRCVLETMLKLLFDMVLAVAWSFLAQREGLTDESNGQNS